MDRLLKKIIQERKRDRFVKFAEKLAEKPIGVLFKIMSNICRSASGLGSASSLDSSPDDIGAYADDFSELFAADDTIRPKVRRISHAWSYPRSTGLPTRPSVGLLGDFLITRHKELMGLRQR